MSACASVPFAWQDKRMLRRIREQIEDYGSALAVYGALTVAGSDKAAEVFQTTHAWLAQMSGFGERTVRSRLSELVKIGAVHVTTPALRGPCTYRLLPFGNDSQTNGNQCRAFGKVSPLPLPGSEEKKKGRVHAKPLKLSVPDRIGLEKKLGILKDRENALRGDTSEQWQRDENPQKLDDLRAVRGQIEDLQNQLLNA